MTQPIQIDRPPRIQPELPFDEIDIPKPPDKRVDGYMRILQVALPALTIVGYIFMAGMGGGRSIWLMLPMSFAVIASIGFSLYSYRKEKQELAAQERKYTTRLVEMNREMLAFHEQQRRFYRHNYPSVEGAQRIVELARAAAENPRRSLRADARLWERRPEDEDFGVIRLGVGTLPSTVVYTVEEADPLTDDPQMREAIKLAEDSRFVADIPVIISLRTPAKEKKQDEESGEREQEAQVKEQQALRTPAVHSLAISGDKAAVHEYTRALLSHFAVFHAPSDALIYLIASKQKEWEWAVQLPHCKESDAGDLCFFLDAAVDADASEAFDADDEGPLDRFLERIRRLLAQRKLQLEESSEGEGQSASASAITLPLIFVVVDLLDAVYDDGSPLKEIESDPAMSLLFGAGDALGAAVLFLTPERTKAPSKCEAVIEVERTTPAANRQGSAQLHFRYAETGVNTPRYLGDADSISQPERMARLAENLAACLLRQSAGAELSASVPFLPFMGFSNIKEMQPVVMQRWQDSSTPQAANWLRAKVGVLAGNKPRSLVFSAKRDGVHGMVAGSTGSGKSELLISLVMAMAINYDPSVVNFVLVDYKGGSAFDAFKELPHCVDLVTNLNADSVTRMFTAISSEMRRRQKLNTDTETKNIVEYRQKGFHLRWADGRAGQPYPFLFIIIDEFAEMIADRAEFRTELEMITRVGRAQGVHLLLAAQRPTGVTDQMRSNIKYRICLRVETPGESRELLRRTDAAFLPNGAPGRGYLQVGNDEVEMIQVAYAGDPYEIGRAHV